MSVESDSLETRTSWVLNVVEKNVEGQQEIEVKIEILSGRDEYSQFVSETLQTLIGRIEDLRRPVPRFKKRGLRRSKKELREVRKKWDSESRSLKAAQDLLEGKTPQKIEFIRDGDGGIAGFKVYQPTQPDKSKK